MIPFPAALDAYTDSRLHKTERRVYRVALTSLDLQGFRPFKLTYLKRKTGIAIPDLYQARKTLVESSYLHREGQLFRLTLTLPVVEEDIEFIYALSDPREPTVWRYVGRTIEPDGRMGSHWSTPGGRVRGWVESLKVSGVRPTMTLIDQCSRAAAGAREAHWILETKKKGQADLNTHIPKVG